MSKAFDSIDYELLLAKLFHHGIRGTTWEWFRNYLLERSQLTVINGNDGPVQSSEATIMSGVPQGSILGPLLFNIFIRDIKNAVKSCNVHFYADDVQLSYSFKPEDAKTAFSKINEDLDYIYKHTTNEGLKINANKTAALLFGNNNIKNVILHQHLTLKMSEEVIVFSETAKNLGVIMDDKLNFKSHVSHICRSAYVTLKGLYHIKDYVTTELKIKLCDSLVLSKLNYCDAVYGPGLTAECSNRIQKVQNSCVRFSMHIPRWQHITPYLKEVGWLSMRERRWVHLCCLVFNVIQTKVPKYLYDKIQRRCDAHDVTTRNCEMTLSIPVHHLETYKKCFAYQAANIYNQLPKSYKQESVTNFKKTLVKNIKTGKFTIQF